MRGGIFAPGVYGVAEALSAEYGDWNHFNKSNPLDELLFIICSVKTGERGYRGTYAALKREFPTFQSLHRARAHSIATILAPGGLSAQKAAAIKSILAAIACRFGSPSLAPLKQMGDPECERFLDGLPGVGKKVARCVMMYSLGRQVFPVDTHCWRICQRLGWVRPTRKDRTCSPRDMDRLQGKIPPELRHGLHVNLVSHGRRTCVAGAPGCSGCAISKYCRKVGVAPVTRAKTRKRGQK
jgi:endonuclease III